jgi:glyoxylase-like metal-dependent hydrolase (beta-lactamase superfamily II)
VPRIDRIVLTHGHVDHCVLRRRTTRRHGCNRFAGAGDAAVIRDGAAMPPPVFEDWKIPIHQRVSAGLPETAPPVPALRELHDGDELDFGGAEILAIPGHTDGSIAIHLPNHGVLFTGDPIANVGTVMLGTFNQDRTQTVASFKRLASLDAETACVGHGEPITADARTRSATLLPH